MPLARSQKVWLALALNWIAGFVDLVAYVALYHVFTANMTGNTVELGEGLVEHRWGLALRRGFAIPVFVLGMILARLMVHLAGRRRLAHTAAILFGAEGIALGAFALLGQGAMEGGRVAGVSTAQYLLLVALPACAMGLQNATLTCFGPLTVRTTHVTGTLAEMSDRLVTYGLWLRDRLRSLSLRRLRRSMLVSRRRACLREAGLLGAVWLSYLAGTLFGALLKLRWELAALAVPVSVLACLVVTDLRWPLLELEGTGGG